MQKLITNLYSAYDQLNKKLFKDELPEIIITIQSKPKTKNSIIYGWCTRDPIWCYKDENNKEVYKYEINLVAEQLNRSYEDTICTLIHEQVHLYNNFVKHVEDCSSRQNHKLPFKEVAEKVGLIVEKGYRTGWSQTTLSPPLRQIVDNLDVDKSAFTLYRTTKEKPKREVHRKPIYKYHCPKCGKEIKSNEEFLNVLCQDCNQYYERINK